MENAVRRLRRALNLSQQKFADLVGRSCPSIQGYEAGKRVPDDVRAKMAALATERGLAAVAAELRAAPARKAAGKAQEATERRRRTHDLVDEILNLGDQDLESIVLGLLERLARS